MNTTTQSPSQRPNVGAMKVERYLSLAGSVNTQKLSAKTVRMHLHVCMQIFIYLNISIVPSSRRCTLSKTCTFIVTNKFSKNSYWREQREPRKELKPHMRLYKAQGLLPNWGKAELAVRGCSLSPHFVVRDCLWIFQVVQVEDVRLHFPS